MTAIIETAVFGLVVGSAVVATALSAPAATVIVAVIVGTSGVLTAMVQSLKRSNRVEHGEVRELLEQIEGRLDRVQQHQADIERKIDGHIAFHAHGSTVRIVKADEVHVEPPAGGEL